MELSRRKKGKSGKWNELRSKLKEQKGHGVQEPEGRAKERIRSPACGLMVRRKGFGK